MFNIGLSSAVASLVEAMLPVGSEHGLFVMCDMRLENDNYNKCASTDMCFIFERSSSYTKVFVAVSDKWQDPDPSAFQLASDHDSCWRSDGIDSQINKHYLLMSEEIQGEEKVAPNQMWQHVNFHTIKPVNVVIDRKRDESYGPNVSSYVPFLVSYGDKEKVS